MKLYATSLVVLLACSTFAAAQEGPPDRPFGPPAEVVAAWEAGEGHLLPGPPEWVVEMRGGGSERPAGPPPWVAARQAFAEEIGLPGPPAEVTGAWENGEGEFLPGPPAFVFELLGMFGWGR